MNKIKTQNTDRYLKFIGIELKVSCTTHCNFGCLHIHCMPFLYRHQCMYFHCWFICMDIN